VRKYWFMSSAECARCGRCGSKAAGSHASQACGNDVDQDGHGTHVAGTIAGKSITATTPATDRLNGVAAGASLFFQDIHNGVSKSDCQTAGLSADCGSGLFPPTDLYHLLKPAFDAGARIHSNSWGCAPDEESPLACNVYSSQAKNIDDFVHSNPDFLVLVAAGNDGALNEAYTIGDPATCKNCLAVGATQVNADQLAADAAYVSPNALCEQVSNPPSCCLKYTCTREDCCNAAKAAGQCAPCCNAPCTLTAAQEKARPSASNLAAFSSRGPTFDARFKPDIVAPGQDIISACAGIIPATDTQAAQAAGAANHCDVGATHTSNCSQTSMSGTSMATPLMAGAMEYVVKLSTTQKAAALPFFSGTSGSISSAGTFPRALPPAPTNSPPSLNPSCVQPSSPARVRSLAQ
jgi:subtilisin family serine protease